MSPITRACIAAGAVALVIGSVPADAQVLEPLKFHTTFAFTVAQMTFPAGDYTIRPLELDGYTLQISNGKETKFIEVEAAGVPASATPKIAPDDEVVFTKSGDQYVLAEIWDAADRTGVEPIPSANQPKSADAQQHHHHHAA